MFLKKLKINFEFRNPSIKKIYLLIKIIVPQQITKIIKKFYISLIILEKKDPSGDLRM